MPVDDEPLPDGDGPAPDARSRRGKPLVDPGPLCLTLFFAVATIAMIATGRTIALTVFASLLAISVVVVAGVAVRRRS